jgi:4-hydroxy-tetrahydrodipicolinate synthase
MFGVHTALVTPFQADGGLDVDAFVRLTERQIRNGIAGLVPCGTTGESPVLDDDEWATLVRAAVDLADGKLPVTAGVGSNDTRATVKKCESALRLGANAGLLVFPYYNKPNPQGMLLHVKAALATGLPLVLYHVPGRTGQRLPAHQLADLANLPGVIAVKEATGDLRYGGDLLVRTRTPVLSGDDFTFLGLLGLGGTGVISVVSNVDPAGTVRVYERFVAGDMPGARDALLALWPLITWLFDDTNPVPCKAALAELGLCRPEPRLPLAVGSSPSPRGMLEKLGLR